MDIEVKTLQKIEFDLLKQVDRTERVEIVYGARLLSNRLGLVLQPIKQEPVMAIPPWSDEGIASRISNWQPEIERGGRLLMALAGKKAVGFGIVGGKHKDGSVELCALFVSSEARQAGIGTRLFQQLEKSAKAQGATSLFIYSNPTQSAVDFYRKQQCEIIGLADKRLVPHLPLDVIFAKPLLKNECDSPPFPCKPLLQLS
ncbi:MAG: GNAT family N-acetyltransferase [Anaerolineae bacterium]|nr:GNAT family N-acetyltransferase [Anaerolineae bacterium]